MAQSLSLEERISRLEQELARLKTQIASPRPEPPWPWNICGSMRNYPEFDEVVRLGREFRQNYKDEFEI